MSELPSEVLTQVDDAVAAFKSIRDKFLSDAEVIRNKLLTDPELKVLIHSVKSRAKDPSHLRDKLIRMASKATKERPFDVTASNLVGRIEDLAGVRVLHLHMKQMERIHPRLLKLLDEEGFLIHGEPEAKTWDPEYKKMFESLGLKVEINESLYTSVHYTLKQNSRNPRLCELQIRTLAEEIWGEVSHTINYPHQTDSVACKEQLKALARFVSGCTRLVDSIVRSYADHRERAIGSTGSAALCTTLPTPTAASTSSGSIGT